MLCQKPFNGPAGEFGCGQCMPCRINRRREWTGRLLLEAMWHQHSVFITLTYSPEHCPSELVPADLSHFLRRLKYAFKPRSFRYYAVGEYGEQHGRPHYHAILFGVDEALIGQLAEIWGKGFVHVGTVCKESIGYVAGYTVKKLAEMEREDGLQPEFARMSLRPGIGALTAAAMGKDMLTNTLGPVLEDIKEKHGDLPARFRAGGKTYPWGKYLKGKLREAVGWDQKLTFDQRQVMLAKNETHRLNDLDTREKFRKNHGVRALAERAVSKSKRVL